ncbi:MAG: hypothetical protein MZW92_53670 [Comamonadaceae bacterium]|nr:hypothetical protein [Comamonadaceae bacterium]
MNRLLELVAKGGDVTRRSSRSTARSIGSTRPSTRMSGGRCSMQPAPRHRCERL